MNSDLKPTTKMTAVGVGGAASTIIIWFLNMGDIDVEPAVAAAITTVVVFILGYFIREN